MMVDALISQLNGVRQRGNSRWSAKCPGHADRSPSLSVSQGDKGILLRCWAGCTLAEICSSLGITQQDLFYDALDTDPSRQREAALHRRQQRERHERHTYQQGTLIDALREADSFVHSRCGIDISSWGHDRLNDELNALATAYTILESEGLHE